jgi:hypothetical protein
MLAPLSLPLLTLTLLQRQPWLLRTLRLLLASLLKRMFMRLRILLLTRN